MLNEEEKQVWDHSLENKKEAILKDLMLSVFDLLAPKAGEKILDIGCGLRSMAKRIADMGCDLTVVSANRKALLGAQEYGLNTMLMKAEALTFRNEFDAIYTNATLHHLRHLDRVVSSVWRALKPGGRFVGEFAARGNVVTIITAAQKFMAKRGIELDSLPHWYYPSQQEFEGFMTKQGFKVQCIETVKVQLTLPCDLEEWLWMFAAHLPSALDEGDRKAFFKEVTEFCRPHLYDVAHDKWTINMARVQFGALKPA